MKPAVALDEIARVIHVVRGHRVMLDSDLAALYGVSPKRLNEQVKRNIVRFPEDFAFQLTSIEIAASNEASALRSQIVTLRLGHGKHRKYRPYAFTEQGVAMLSSVLRSERAVQVNIEIMRAFIRLKQWALSVTDLTTRLDALEGRYDRQFKVVFDAIRELMTPGQRRIGF